MQKCDQDFGITRNLFPKGKILYHCLGDSVKSKHTFSRFLDKNARNSKEIVNGAHPFFSKPAGDPKQCSVYRRQQSAQKQFQ